MTRWKASAIHLALSLVLLLIIALLLIWRWYPPGLFHAARADKLLTLIAGVDLFIGPLLTLIVYKHGKRTLKFDLAVIALLQISALTYALYATWLSRPVYLVASGRSVDLVFANEVDPAILAEAQAGYRELPAFGPRLVALGGAAPLWQAMNIQGAEADPRNYRPYEEISETLRAASSPLSGLLQQLSAEDRKSLTRTARQLGRPVRDLAAIPLHSSRGHAAMLLDRNTGELIRPVAVNLP